VIDDHKYSVHDNFKLYIFKNCIEKNNMKMDQNIFFNMLVINFNLRKEDIKDKIFIELSKKRNESAYASFKKLRNDIIKQSLAKLETENKMINSILQLDISGNVDKLQSNESINEKYKTECQLYSKINHILKNCENNYIKQKISLEENYGIISKQASALFKWIFKFNLLKICFLINPDTLNKYLLEFYDEKILILREYKENEKRKLKEQKRKIILSGESNESNVDYLESEKEEKDNDEKEESYENNEDLDENIEVINPVISEEYVFKNKEDTKSLFIFFYNKINKIYTNKDLNYSFLLFMSILCFNFQNKIQIPFKNAFNNYYLSHSEFEELIDKEDLVESPISNISMKEWTLVNKINESCGGLFQNIIENIEANKEKWNIYLSEKLEGSVENHYYINDLVLPDENLENNTILIVKFIFFLTVKPNKKEFIINHFIQNTFIKIENDDEIIQDKNNKQEKSIDYISRNLLENYENYDLTTAFKNFDLKKDNALVLFAPSKNINIYDNILYNECYLKMFVHGATDKNHSKLLDTITSNNNDQQNSKDNTNNKNKNNDDSKDNNLNSKTDNEGNQPAQGAQISNEIKYREIILENSDMTQQDYDSIKNNIKLGNVIIIKHAEFLGNFFTQFINDIFNFKTEEISHNFKLILICNEGDAIQNKLIFEKCRIISEKIKLENSLEDLTENENEEETIKKSILRNICKISNKIYNKLINNNNIYMRAFLRKLIFHYLLLFGVLENYPLNNPFCYSNKDFLSLCHQTINFIESELQNEDKYKEFMNIENNSGYNYQSLFQILNNTFIFSRQINQQDKYKVNDLVNYIINSKNILNKEFYLNINEIQIKISELPIGDDLTFKDIYNTFNCIYSSKFESCMIANSEIENIDNQANYAKEILQNVYNVINTDFNISENNSEKKYDFDMYKIHQLLLKIEENIPYDIPFMIKEGGVELQSGETINPSLFKKNKYGIYFNGLDESLYYELSLFNKKLTEIHREISNLIKMIKGEINYKKEYFEIFSCLSENNVPAILNIYNDIKYLNIPLNVMVYIKIVKHRISLYKDWLKEGNLNCYHLPIFTNVELFIHSLKMNFCRKYYGENDFSKITPDRVMIKFIHTKFKSFKDLSSNEKVLKYYKNIYKNEIIWVDGFVLNNAFISENGKIIFNNQEKKIKNKMNIVGITYNIEQFFEENINESETNSINDEDEEEEEKSESKEKESVSEEKNKLKDNKLKVYIYGNGDQCLYNKYYENESIGCIEFDSDEKIEQDFIYKNDIKITIEDLEDFL